MSGAVCLSAKEIHQRNKTQVLLLPATSLSKETHTPSSGHGVLLCVLVSRCCWSWVLLEGWAWLQCSSGSSWALGSLPWPGEESWTLLEDRR